MMPDAFQIVCILALVALVAWPHVFNNQDPREWHEHRAWPFRRYVDSSGKRIDETYMMRRRVGDQWEYRDETERETDLRHKAEAW
jgi:hypothetical protein